MLWKRITKRFPAPCVSVLVLYKDGVWYEAYRDHTGVWSGNRELPEKGKPTHYLLVDTSNKE